MALPGVHPRELLCKYFVSVPTLHYISDWLLTESCFWLYQSDQVLTGDKEVKYHIDVHTGKHSGAATKADISVVLIGVNGRTKYLPLSKALTAHKIKFKKNQVN